MAAVVSNPEVVAAPAWQRSWRKKAEVAAIASLATPLLSSGSGNAEAATTKAAGSRALAPSTYEARVQRWVNKKRAHHNLRRVRLSRCPDGTAERWSRHLAATGRHVRQTWFIVAIIALLAL